MIPYVAAVVLEVRDGRLTPLSASTLRLASLLAPSPVAPAVAVVMGRGAARAAHEGLPGPWEPYVIDGPDLEPYNPDTWKARLREVFGDLAAPYIFLPHTSRGWDCAPALAVALGGCVLTAVEEVRIEEGRVIFTRSLCRGRLREDVVPLAFPAVVTCLPREDGDDARQTPPEAPGGETPAPGNTGGRGRIRPLGVKTGGGGARDLDTAEVVVAVGRGIGREEDLPLVHRLASLFPKSAVACSRPVCDSGWLPFRRQVGITGRTVAPSLYVACGISGTQQHVSGMRNSRTVIAVNRDAQAPIFRHAHFGVVADLPTFIREVLALADPDEAILKGLVEQLRQGPPWATPGELTAAAGRLLLERPYREGTLEGTGEEYPVVNLRAFDCVTFVETALALAMTVSDAGGGAFAAHLARLRYRGGVCRGYASRLHYLVDWFRDAERKGVLRDITARLGGRAVAKTINFMTRHRRRYGPLGDQAVFEALAAVEEELSKRPYHVLGREDLAAREGDLREGDIVAVAAGEEGLDCSHVGICVIEAGRPHLLHASSREGRVVISKETLAAYIATRRDAPGVIVARPEIRGHNT